MDTYELSCRELLSKLVEHYPVVGVKTSFEDEGASFNEVVRLKNISNLSNTNLVIKIGGAEAIRDINDSLIIGATGIVAPMIESEFALRKFVEAIDAHACPEISKSIRLSINIETICAAQNLDKILNSKHALRLFSVTVGRVDLAASMDLQRQDVDGDEVYQKVRTVFTKVKEKGIKTCLGGAITVNSINFIRKLSFDKLLDLFETRNVILNPPVKNQDYLAVIRQAQEFEKQWLLAKSHYYQALAIRNRERMEMLTARIRESSIL